jgi:hypothetical protein
VVGADLLRAPRRGDEHPPPGEAADEVADHRQRRGVGKLEVVEEEEPRRPGSDERREHVGEPFVQPLLGGGAVGPGLSLAAADLGHEPGGLGAPVGGDVRQRLLAGCVERRADRGGHEAEGDPRLALV